MDDTMLAQALAEVSGILKGMGQKEGVHVLSVDAQVHACRKVFRTGQVQLTGGGGTDMGKGLSAVAKLRPVPQVAVVITDFYTPWPELPPKNVKVIGVALGSSNCTNAPQWIKVVRVGDKGE
jgi:predicted metal-dependent peptidase